MPSYQIILLNNTICTLYNIVILYNRIFIIIHYSLSQQYTVLCKRHTHHIILLNNGIYNFIVLLNCIIQNAYISYYKAIYNFIIVILYDTKCMLTILLYCIIHYVSNQNKFNKKKCPNLLWFINTQLQEIDKKKLSVNKSQITISQTFFPFDLINENQYFI